MNINFNPNRVQWYDGKVLSCHDFQQSEMLVYNTIGYLNSIISPYSWGVIQIEIDTSSIVQNIVRIIRLDCIMQDSTLVKYAQPATFPVEIDLSSHKNDEQEITIYCNLATEHSVVANDFASQRYAVAQSVEVLDQNIGENPKLITRLEPFLTLSTKTMSSNNIPIVKIKFTGPLLKMVEYDPPSPSLTLCKYTCVKFKQVLNDLQERLAYSINQSKIKNNDNELKKYGRSIMQEIYPIIALFNSSNPNPFQVYLALTRLCGRLSYLVTSQRLDPNYKHDEIGKSFEHLFQYLRVAMSEIDKIKSLDLYRFTYRTDGVYLAELSNPKSGTIDVSFQFAECIDYRQWIQNATIASEGRLREVILDKKNGCNRKIKSISTVDDYNQILVEVQLNHESVIDRNLCIVNYINASDQPVNIYLLN